MGCAVQLLHCCIGRRCPWEGCGAECQEAVKAIDQLVVCLRISCVLHAGSLDGLTAGGHWRMATVHGDGPDMVALFEQHYGYGGEPLWDGTSHCLRHRLYVA